MTRVTLTIQSPEGTTRVPLTGDSLTLGRGDVADIRINDPGLSRLHASIHCEDGRVWILDENSTNGSYVNGELVAASGAALADGDKISIGNYTTIWVSVSGSDSPAEKAGARTGADGFPPAAIAGLIVAAILASLLLLSIFNTRSVDRRVVNQPPPNGVEKKAADSGEPSANDNSRAANGGDNENYNSNQNIDSNSSGNVSFQTGARKLYLQMSEAEGLEFTYERARHISRMMGNREYQFTDDVLPYIKRYLDSYARRVGNKSTQLWGEDLERLFGRARRLAPVIIRAFNSQGVPAVVGLYIPMIESEYRDCLTSPVGAKGLFQFMPDTARAYGVDPGDRCDAEKMAPAAAKYMKHRIAEFGTDAMSVALGIAGYNRSPDSVRRDLADVLNSENKERSFWTLIANSDKLDRYFQNENVKYVPKFFAAAIVGETPWSFGLKMNPLSTYTERGDGD